VTAHGMERRREAQCGALRHNGTSGDPLERSESFEAFSSLRRFGPVTGPLNVVPHAGQLFDCAGRMIPNCCHRLDLAVGLPMPKDRLPPTVTSRNPELSDEHVEYVFERRPESMPSRGEMEPMCLAVSAVLGLCNILRVHHV
ncbi:MAG: hypothetical protein Q4F67_06520, partial [Propionibacteriaceae bacterium]|nr:hypothetical protein [Propionibacteriaceae bacterium]